MIEYLYFKTILKPNQVGTKMKNLIKTIIFLLMITVSIQAQTTLFKNVKIFDGKTDGLIEGQDILVEKNLISKIGSNLSAPEGSAIIDGKGMTLMPGIIEGHGHVGLPIAPGEIGTTEDWQYTGVLTTVVAKNYLDHGWTTVRDVGGMVSGIKKAIDEGHVAGPRIFPSGMYISQTSGHGDFRRYADGHPNTIKDIPFFNKYYGHIADGVSRSSTSSPRRTA